MEYILIHGVTVARFPLHLKHIHLIQTDSFSGRIYQPSDKTNLKFRRGFYEVSSNLCVAEQGFSFNQLAKDAKVAGWGQKHDTIVRRSFSLHIKLRPLVEVCTYTI